MRRNNASTFSVSQNRMNQLDQSIDDLFAHLAPDEIDILAQNFVRSTTRMITVIKIGKRSSLVMDLMEDIEFDGVLFPEELNSLLRRHDVFLTTMGFRDDRWHVLYMSPLYRT
jgi:hypothetical protein